VRFNKRATYFKNDLINSRMLIVCSV